jgi:diaminohydroxyphosphoribosylaminopyrimidine deaminase / 5-amino-6-(5-phosphoribosylamino)uracil reductase
VRQGTTIVSSHAPFTSDDERHMRRALELALLGQGYVEPNPMVGAVVVRDGTVVGEGWHRRYGDAHAEVEALRVAGENARGATLFVTLEPCCHHGKQPPCVDAVLAAGVRRVVAAVQDPNAAVSGKGFARLRAEGLQVEVGLLGANGEGLIAPFTKYNRAGLPWVIAKWAMTLDGKIATRTKDSKWISNASSREVGHRLRGRVDAIVVGRGTLEADDPLLTARLPLGEAPPRVAARIVLDSAARIAPTAQLFATIKQAPVIVAVGGGADERRCAELTRSGAEVLRLSAVDKVQRLRELLVELRSRAMTNVLFEGGSEVLGTLRDGGLIDEVHAFIAPCIAGGSLAASPLAGEGVAMIQDALRISHPAVELLEGDIYVSGQVTTTSTRSREDAAVG